jgi:signal transduction histidine kinase
MKLLTRTTIYFTTIALLVFAIGGVVFYHELRSTTQGDADERLSNEKSTVVNYIHNHQSLPTVSLTLGDSIAYHSVAGPVKERLADTIIFNVAEKEHEPYRKIEFGTCIAGQCYSITIFKPLIEADDLTNAIVQTIGIIAIMLLLVLILSNVLIAKSLWKPFYHTLDKVKAFDLTKKSTIVFENATLKEFKELNNVLKVMTEKMSADYNSLKEFTENASHELQTPLAIIQSKLELLIQSENLSAKQMEEVQVVYESTARLSKLNQALLLLAKIENMQFGEVKEVELDKLIESKLELFEDLIKHKNLSVEKNIEYCIIQAHPSLADILISNLIGNAIKHNMKDGILKIELNKSGLIISNSGNTPSVPTEQFFQRFRKSDPASDSLGLGLAIVKEICNAYGFVIYYKYEGGLHILSISF